MYCFNINLLNQMNIESKLSKRQIINIDGIHWLNPLVYKCDIRI